MTRLQKVAVFNIAMMIVAAGLVLILFHLTGSSFSLCGMVILAVLYFNRWMFKGKGGPKWDERENKIARRAALIGYGVFWMFFFMSAWMYATVIGRRIVVPLWCFTFVPVVGAYILLISMMLAVVWLAREPEGGWGRLVGFCVLIILLSLPLVGTGVLLARGFETPCAGSYQADEWHVTAGGEVVAHSRINLTRWPKDWPAMPITLPYENAKVISATFRGEPVKARELEKGKYELDLAEKFAVPFDMTVEVVWTIPLSELESAPPQWFGPYRARLSSLIPTNAFSLKVLLEPNCGFEFVGGGDNRWTYPFTAMRGDGIYTQKWGSCSMCIRRAEAKGDVKKQ